MDSIGFGVVGQPVHADQDPGRLLLLRVRTSGVPPQPRLQLRQHGPADDRRYQASHLHATLVNIVSKLPNYYCYFSSVLIVFLCNSTWWRGRKGSLVLTLPININFNATIETLLSLSQF